MVAKSDWMAPDARMSVKRVIPFGVFERRKRAAIRNVEAEDVANKEMQFSPMSSRERRIVHLALRDEADLHTESEGEGMRRCLVVYPKDYKPAGKPAPRTLP